VHPDADHVAGIDGVRIELHQRFVDDERVAVLGRGGGRQYKKPTRGDDGDAKGKMTGIDEVNPHRWQV
jgi:hypothetical protein